MIGDHLGKWIIYKELGRGGMGRVYLAQEEIGGRQAALKILAPELAQSAGFLERFQREIETLSKLDHSHIVRFYEAGFENGLYFYAMEYVDGLSLEDILAREGRLPWADVLDLALQICPALKQVHDHGIIHRDLKPANILRSAGGVIKLTDFGIAKVFAQGHLTASGGIVGTAEFLSPEQAAGKPVTKRSDLYSLGAVLYTLVTGRPPFAGESFLDLLHKHRYGQFDAAVKLVPELPYEIDEVINNLLAKDPADRPPDCLVLGKTLDAIRRKLDRKGNATQDAFAEDGTVAENRVGSRGGRDNPGQATLMSQLIRQELNRQNRGGPINQLLSRWFVVIPLFVLVMGVLLWTFWPPSAETLFERGAELMQSDYASDWDRAWYEYLEPLEHKHPDHPHKSEVESFRKKIEAHRNFVEHGSAVSEGQRLYQLGERLSQEGHYAEAGRLWKNVVAVFNNVDSEKDWVAKAEQALAKLHEAAAARKRLAPVWTALQQAAALCEQGKQAEAKIIWQGIEELYQSDPAAAEVLEAIKRARAKQES